MKGKKLCVFVGLAVTLSACTTYQIDAATYKWTDNKGQINYTQTPPNNALAATLITTPNLVEPPVLKNKKANQLLVQKDQEMTVIQEYNCKEAKNLLNSLEQAGDKQVAVLDNQGNKKYLSNDERENYSIKAKEEVKKYCNG